MRKEKQVLSNTLLENTWMAEAELNLMDIQGTVTSVEFLRYQWSEAHKNKPSESYCTWHFPPRGEKKEGRKLVGFFAFRKQSIHAGIALTRQSLRLSSPGRGPDKKGHCSGSGVVQAGPPRAV